MTMDELQDQRRHNFTIIDNPAMDDMHLTPSEFTVYCHIARMADNTTKECFPAVATLAKRTCVSERQVRRVIKRLIELGMLTKSPREGKSSIYTVTDVSEWVTDKVTNVTPDKSTRGTNVIPTPDKSTTRTILSSTNTKTNADGVDDKSTAQLLDEIPPVDWNDLKPAWKKVTPIIAEYYGIAETDGLCKVLACYFTRESRHIKKGSEWEEYHLDVALSVDELKTMLQHWKMTLPAMPTKPMTIQANVSKWKTAPTDNDKLKERY